MNELTPTVLKQISPGQSDAVKPQSAALGNGCVHATFALKGQNKRAAVRREFVLPFQGGEVLFSSQPRAALCGFTASLCPGLICGGPFGAGENKRNTVLVW